MADIDKLNHEYSMPGRIVFREGVGGLVFADLANEQGNAVVALQGGHLIDWTPKGQEAVIWLSRNSKFSLGKPIRGGVPVCWPWFGPHSREGSFPAHGFARTAAWQVANAGIIDGEITRLELMLSWNDAFKRYWPYQTEALIQISLGSALEIELISRNTGTIPVCLSEALHTYFNVGDIRDIFIHGLEDCEYLDKVDAMKRKRQHGVIRIKEETDRVYLDTESDCFIEDPHLGRRIRISKQGSRSTVVWNPWREKAAKMEDFGADGYLNMVCVESANAAVEVVSILPGKVHRLKVSYRLESHPKSAS